MSAPAEQGQGVAPPGAPSPDLRLFEPLLEDLRQGGFTIGVREYLRLQLLFAALDPEQLLPEGPDSEERRAALRSRYRTLIRPLLATNPDQQRDFDAAYDRFCDRPPPKSNAPDPVLPPEAPKRPAATLDRERLRAWMKDQIPVPPSPKHPPDWRTPGLRALISALLLLALLSGITAAMRATYTLQSDSGFTFPRSRAWKAPYPPQELRLTLHREGGAPGFLARWFAPTLIADAPTGAGITVTLEGRPEDPDRPVRAQFVPTDAQVYTAPLRLAMRNPFDRVSGFSPAAPRLRGEAVRLTSGYRIHAAGSTAPVTRISLTADVGEVASSEELVLEAVPGSAMGPKQLPQLTAPAYFSVVARGAQPTGGPRRFVIQFRPGHPSSEPFETRAVLVSGRKDVEDPPEIVVQGTSTRVPESVTRDLPVTIRGAGPQWTYRRRPLRWDEAAPYAAGTLVLIFLLLGPGGLWIIRTQSFRRPADQPPFKWLPAGDPPGSLFPALELSEAATLLGARPSREDCLRLDLPATVRATTLRAGFATPVYRPDRSEAPEYLALVECRGPSDQFTAYSIALLEGLRRQGVLIRICSFGDTPELCRDVERQVTLPLDQVLRRYPDHRILVFAESRALVDLASAQLHSSAHELDLHAAAQDPFSNWALFTPEDVSRPGARIRQLQRAFPRLRFGIFQADLSGVLDFARAFPVSGGPSLAGGQSTGPAARRAEPEVPLSLETVSTDEHLNALSGSYLRDDPRLFWWLCACALLPHVSLGLTLALGRALEAMPLTGTDACHVDQSTPVVTQQHLLRLLRLDWFRRGELPEELRQALEMRLPLSHKCQLRRLLVEILGRHPLPPWGSVARERVELERRVQDWLRSASEGAAALRERVEAIPRHLLYSHPRLAACLEEKPEALWADQPAQGRAMRRRYRLGIRRLDHELNRPWLARALVIAMGPSVALMAGLMLAPRGNREQILQRPATLAMQTPTQLDFGRIGVTNGLVVRLLPRNEHSLPVEFRATVSGTSAGVVRELPAHTSSDSDSPLDLLLPDAVREKLRTSTLRDGGDPAPANAPVSPGPASFAPDLGIRFVGRSSRKEAPVPRASVRAATAAERVVLELAARLPGAAPGQPGASTRTSVVLKVSEQVQPGFHPATAELKSVGGAPVTREVQLQGLSLPRGRFRYLGSNPRFRTPIAIPETGDNRTIRITYQPDANDSPGSEHRETLVFLGSKNQELARLSLTGTIQSESPNGSEGTADLRLRALEVAALLLRTGEQPPGNNRGPEVDVYNQAAGAPLGSPWCGSFVYYCFSEASRWTKYPVPIPRTASVQVLYDWAHRNQRLVSEPQPGDVFVMRGGTGRFSITGLVAAPRALAGSSFVAIEGNTAAKGVRESTSVVVRERDRSACQFIRPAGPVSDAADALTAIHRLEDALAVLEQLGDLLAQSDVLGLQAALYEYPVGDHEPVIGLGDRQAELGQAAAKGQTQRKGSPIKDGHVPLPGAAPPRRPTTYSISGRVLDLDTKMGLPDVEVQAGGQLTLTAADGTYRLDGVRSGKQSVTVSKPGYSGFPEAREVTVGPGRNEVNFSMKAPFMESPLKKSPGRFRAK